jgi:mitochondrial GTPase 1
MRTYFPCGSVNWYPGHMHKATQEITKKLHKADIFLEVRDARAPLSSANNLYINKPKIILLNKIDLCSMSYTLKIVEKLKSEGENILTYSAYTNQNINRLIAHIKNNVPNKYKTVGSWIMIGGVPNVGKSSIINSFRAHSRGFYNANPTKTGPEPCVTRGVEGFKVCVDPLVYLIDTPGIMLPKLKNNEQAMKLALIGAIRDEIVGADIIADFMLFSLNKLGNFNYVQKYKLKGPVDTLEQLLHILKPKYNWDELSISKTILKHFREGKLGKITLDKLSQLPN